MTSIIVNADTLNSSYLENSPICTFRNVSNVSYLSPNSFQTRITLPYPLYGTYRIFLKNLQLPVSINNIRSTSNLNTIGIYTGLDSSGNKLNHLQVIIPDNYYSTITSLLTEINALFASYYPSYNVVFSQNSTNSNYLQVSSTSFSTIYVDSTNLSQMLGFNPNLNVIGTNVTSASVVYKLSIDDYICMYIGNTSNTCINTNKTPCSFKIPLNSVNSVVYYHENSNAIFVNTDFSTVSYFDIYMFDRFGYSLHSGNVDYSFTLQIDCLVD